MIRCSLDIKKVVLKGSRRKSRVLSGSNLLLRINILIPVKAGEAWQFQGINPFEACHIPGFQPTLGWVKSRRGSIVKP